MTEPTLDDVQKELNRNKLAVLAALQFIETIASDKCLPAGYNKRAQRTRAAMNEALTAKPDTLPCPFCGERMHIEMREGLASTSRWIVCGSCDAAGPVKHTEAEAITAWNKVPRPHG